MKILFFGTYFPPYISGITTYPLKVLTQLAKDHQVAVLTFNHLENQLNEEKINGIKVKRMPYWWRISKGFFSPQSWACFWSEVKKTDTVILNFPNAEGLILALLARVFGKKIVGVFHCRVFLGFTWNEKLVEWALNSVVLWQMMLSDVIVAYTKDYFESFEWPKGLTKKVKIVLPPVEKIDTTQQIQPNTFRLSM